MIRWHVLTFWTVLIGPSFTKKRDKMNTAKREICNMSYMSQVAQSELGRKEVKRSAASWCCSVSGACLNVKVMINALLEQFLWCSHRNVRPEPPASAFSCPNHLPLNTDGAKASASSDGFRAAMWCGVSQQIWAEPSRNVPGTLSALLFRGRGCHNEGNVVRGGEALMRPCNHLTETRCSVSYSRQ